MRISNLIPMIAAGIMALSSAAFAGPATCSGLGPDNTCSVYVQGEMFWRAAQASGATVITYGDAPDVVFNAGSVAGYNPDSNTVFVNENSTQRELFNSYVMWYIDEADARRSFANASRRYVPLGTPGDIG